MFYKENSKWIVILYLVIVFFTYNLNKRKYGNNILTIRWIASLIMFSWTD